MAKRTEAVNNFVNSKDSIKIFETINRVLKITQGNKVEGKPDEALFNNEEEKTLYSVILNSPEITYQNINEIERFIEPLNLFFDKVLVMDKDEKIKNNRLKLLNVLAEKFNLVCDFSKISTK